MRKVATLGGTRMRFSVSKKIWAGFSVLLLLMLVLGAAAYFSTGKMNTEFNKMLDDRMHKVNLADELIIAQKEQYSAISSFVLFKTTDFAKSRDAATEEADLIISELETLFAHDKDSALVEDITTMNSDFREMVDSISYMLMRSNDVQTRVALKDANNLNNSLMEKANELKDHQLKEMKNAREDLSQMTNVIKIVIVLLIIAAIALSLIVTYLINRKIGMPVKAMTAALQRIADGDLGVEEVDASSNDEIGDMAAALNKMNSDLRDLWNRSVSLPSNLPHRRNNCRRVRRKALLQVKWSPPLLRRTCGKVNSRHI